MPTSANRSVSSTPCLLTAHRWQTLSGAAATTIGRASFISDLLANDDPANQYLISAAIRPHGKSNATRIPHRPSDLPPAGYPFDTPIFHERPIIDVELLSGLSDIACCLHRTPRLACPMPARQKLRLTRVPARLSISHGLLRAHKRALHNIPFKARCSDSYIEDFHLNDALLPNRTDLFF
jgi:hypothetical protein